MHSLLLLLILALASACGPSSGSDRFDPALDGLSVTAVNPGLVLPGSRLIIHGRSFVGAPWGDPTMVMQGRFDNGAETYDVEVALPASFIDLETLEVQVDDAFLDLLGSTEGEFDGSIRIDIDSSIDQKVHSSNALGTELSFRSELTPVVQFIQDSGPLFVNDKILVETEGLLLGGDEGTTYAVVDGCFTSAEGGACVPVATTEIALVPSSPFDRTQGAFAFVPEIAGIRPGQFEGVVILRNRHGTEVTRDSQEASVAYDLSKTAIFSVGPQEVSLGQYLNITGGGFVGDATGASTLLELRGQFTPMGGRPVDVDIILVPEFVEGRRLRYTVSEDDTLGQMLDLRYARGSFAGELLASTSYDGDTVTGDAMPFAIDLAPVKQIIYLNFTSQYLDALRAFGLRAMDAAIRERVTEAVRRDYRTINLEIRLEPPDDFSLYSIVEVGGGDPNGLGLLGYDNTPGKDSGNNRLHDHIGGVNATTQEDGFPGYGGVFIESLFIFSEHPGEFAPEAGVSDPLFDDIFDSFRPDRGGEPVRAADLAGGIALPTSGTACPARQRADQIGCAAWTLANLIASTVSHEIGHSLGLANPDGGNSHHLSDGPNRLMDSGSSRPFDERAELRGAGPGQFCDEAYEYLRLILPTAATSDLADRPTCF